MGFFSKILNATDPKIGKTVIRFTTHGCMGQTDEFDFIGKIVGIAYPKHCDGKKFYKVEVLKAGSYEKRNNNLKREYEEVPAWYLQDIGGDFFVAYD
jgi:hypothetical protein